MVMGALARSGPAASAGLSSGGGMAGMLATLLDSNRDGSIVDDVTGMIGKFMKKP
jgi:hypothetical protein